MTYNRSTTMEYREAGKTYAQKNNKNNGDTLEIIQICLGKCWKYMDGQEGQSRKYNVGERQKYIRKLENIRMPKKHTQKTSLS